MERSSQVILRREALLRPGPILLVNPPRDALFRQVQTGERPVRVSTQNYGDYCWLAGSGGDVSFDVLPKPDKACRTVILNLPREKERLQMMLHSISSWMSPDAGLWLVGENRAGIKSAGRYLGQYFRNVAKLDSARHCVLFEATQPSNERAFLLMPVGYPAAEAEVPNLNRKDLDEVSTFIE